jgi:hypothetical protein
MATDHFDDPNIPDEERLFRRIHLTHIVQGDGGESEVSSAALRDAAGWIVPDAAPPWEEIRLRKEQLRMGGKAPGAA